MKKFLSVLMVAGLIIFSACTNNENKTNQALLDSLKKDSVMNDSIAKVAEKVKADSVAKADSVKKADSIAKTKKVVKK